MNNKTPEKWVSINGYDGLYSVSNHGRIASHHWGKYRILQQHTNHRGYYKVSLTKNGKLTTFSVHRLVAEHFLPNPYGLTEINHKDENKSNNIVNNLEWCSRSYNVNYGTRTSRQRLSTIKGVVQFDKNGDVVAEYDSITQASKRIGASTSHIVGCCKRKYPSARGFIWRYSREVQNET